MKNRLGTLCSLGLVLILAATLTPVGTHVIEAKSATAASWQVAIPKNIGDVNLAGVSLQPDNGNAIFEDQGLGGPVRVILSRTKVKGQLSYHFHLLFYPGTSGYGTVIGGVELDNFEITDGEIPNCFPVRQECPYEPNMACFLNGNHPYSNYDFEIQVGTLDDVEKLGIGDVAYGRIHLLMWDHEDEFGDFHRLHCESDPRVINIERTGADEWTISNVSIGGHTLHCEEYYVATVPRAGKKDGDARVKYEERVVMTADTVAPFVFETIWTRK